jgi:hypothetical protein
MSAISKYQSAQERLDLLKVALNQAQGLLPNGSAPDPDIQTSVLQFHHSQGNIAVSAGYTTAAKSFNVKSEDMVRAMVVALNDNLAQLVTATVNSATAKVDALKADALAEAQQIVADLTP